MSVVLTRRSSGEAGFTLVESLVAMALTLLITSAALGLLNPTMLSTVAQPETTDLQQRARVAVDALARDIAAAGAGAAVGVRRGTIARALPPIVPRRLGFTGADAPVVAKADTITLLSIAAPLAVAELGAPLTDPTSPFVLVHRAGCPAPADFCGMTADTPVLVFGDDARFATFGLTDVAGLSARLTPRQSDAGYPFPAGATAAAISFHTYYLDTTTHQLRHYDGYLTDVPLVDHVVDLGFEYFGDPEPPAWPRPPLGTANCLYDTSGTRIGGLEWLATAGGSLAPLPASSFTDGPWCGAGSTRFDADLLRIRSVRVTLRFEAAAATSRAQGGDYRQAGTSRSAWNAVADATAVVDVAPRNLNLGR